MTCGSVMPHYTALGRCLPPGYQQNQTFPLRGIQIQHKNKRLLSFYLSSNCINKQKTSNLNFSYESQGYYSRVKPNTRRKSCHVTSKIHSPENSEFLFFFGKPSVNCKALFFPYGYWRKLGNSVSSYKRFKTRAHYKSDIGEDAAESVRSLSQGLFSMNGITKDSSNWLKEFPKRWQIVTLCFFAFLLCNMDRVNMSIAILPMATEFNWSPSTVGLVQSSFFWGYLVTQIAGGIWADKLGGKVVLGFGVIWWSLATVLTPIAARVGLPVLLLVRAFMGVGEKRRSQKKSVVVSSLPCGISSVGHSLEWECVSHPCVWITSLFCL